MAKTIRLKAKIAEIETKPLIIRTPYIELQAALKLCNIAQTGGHAKILITEEQCVFVNGEICTQRGKKLYNGDTLRVGRESFVIASEAE
ncbi:MAG: RNA-binding S4 domain-containing protein [Clostridia bacterium]|nr:RNA-binding S4 domain-containing protein [Clostridia bacterium]MBR2413972.1 RNA-binding S4 domain-containing protein [Clostridia bacterium]MBR3955861.1 RNA-binding S4 domain-containing protein [Clostridia bacterium]